MDNRPRFQSVSQSLITRSLEFAAALVAHYAAGGSPMSRSRSGARGTEANVPIQQRSKIGECALALFFDLDPLTAVKWGLVADGGTDVIIPVNLRADVKTTFPPRLVIWSNNVNDLYWHKTFDVIVGVSIDPEDYRRCWIEGFVPKAYFYQHKQIANGVNCGLERGTWFMPKADLAPIDLLLPVVRWAA